IQHHHDISDPGLHIIETNIISAGFAAIEVQAGNQQQLVTAVESVLDGAGNGSFDSPDVHGHSACLRKTFHATLSVSYSGLSSTSSTMPTTAASTGTNSTGRAKAASFDAITNPSSSIPAWWVASTATKGSPAGSRWMSSGWIIRNVTPSSPSTLRVATRLPITRANFMGFRSLSA